MNKWQVKCIAMVLLCCSYTASANDVSEQVLKSYQEAGAGAFDAESGASMWQQKFANNRSCVSCHGADISQSGKHVKTRKLIKPMALSVNSNRYQSTKKINKWFKRNCKWTLGRECTAQEKGDFLTWLMSQ